MKPKNNQRAQPVGAHQMNWNKTSDQGEQTRREKAATTLDSFRGGGARE